jgi:hypothetical protein
MINLRSCASEQKYFERGCRQVRSPRPKSFKKSISKQSTNLFRNFYFATNICEEITKYANPKSDLSIQFQLLQPNTHCYEQLLQAVFSTIHESALAKPAMLDFCLQLYVNNNTLADIRNFAENYQAEDSIHWYTKESFVYRCVNQTLRSGDIDKCHSLRFYIADLSAQLHALKCQQQKTMETAGITVLYRGTRLSDEELNILQSLVGRVVAVKYFMSTSRNKDIALTYASPSDGQAENSRPVLLEIHVDLSSPAIIAADITRMSNFNEEYEVLFHIGSTFRVEMLTFDAVKDMWFCQFTAINENLTHIQGFRTIPFNMSLCKLMSYENDLVYSNETMSHELGDATKLKFLPNGQQKSSWLVYKLIDWAFIRHIGCIIQWQQNDIDKLLNTGERTLEIYAQVDVEDSSDDLQIASCMNDVSYVNLLCGKHMQFINLFKDSLNRREKYLPPDHILLAQSYRNLGLAYANLCDYRTAFELHERALRVNHHASIAAQWSTVTTLRNMGHLYHRSGNHTGAMEYYSKAIETYYKCLNFFIPIKP